MNEKYVSRKKACLFFGISISTIRAWDKKGRIQTIKTSSNQRRYDISSVTKNKNKTGTASNKKRVCYCRVSSRKQMDDLERQKSYLKALYPNHEIVSDIGSGINWKRKNLLSILEQSNKGLIEEVVVAHRDRLARFCFELLYWILDKNGTKLVVLNDEVSEDEKLSDDIMSIIHIFSCRKMGARKYKKNRETKKD